MGTRITIVGKNFGPAMTLTEILVVNSDQGQKGNTEFYRTGGPDVTFLIDVGSDSVECGFQRYLDTPSGAPNSAAAALSTTRETAVLPKCLLQHDSITDTVPVGITAPHITENCGGRPTAAQVLNDTHVECFTLQDIVGTVWPGNTPRFVDPLTKFSALPHVGTAFLLPPNNVTLSFLNGDKRLRSTSGAFEDILPGADVQLTQLILPGSFVRDCNLTLRSEHRYTAAYGPGAQQDYNALTVHHNMLLDGTASFKYQMVGSTVHYQIGELLSHRVTKPGYYTWLPGMYNCLQSYVQCAPV